jgi:hypothetical protein
MRSAGGRPAAIRARAGFGALLCALALPLAAQDLRFVQQSNPPGILSSDAVRASGSVDTLTAPLISGDQRFTGWTFTTFAPGGTPCTGSTPPAVAPVLRDVAGRGINPVTFQLLENTCATANFLPVAQDSDADGVADWYEIAFYGDLARAANADTDIPSPDGIPLAAEARNELHAGLRDTFIPGGISADLGPLAFIILDPNYFLYTERSDPRTLIPTVDLPLPRNSTVTTPTVAPLAQGLAFANWSVNGVPVFDGLGIAANPAQATITGPTEAVAAYVDPDRDSDADGLPDWFERRHGGGAGLLPTGDEDGDGISNLVEFRNGLVPGVRESFLAGGISADLSPVVQIPLQVLLGWTIRSQPAGIVPTQTGSAAAGTVVTTPEVFGIVSGLVFGFWDVNGTRQVDTLGIPRSQVALALSAPTTTFTANLYDPNADSDTDGLPDWYELGYYGSNDTAPGGDADGDGISDLVEARNGLNPRLRESFLPGGISADLSANATLDLRPFPRVREVLVSGLPEFFFANQPPELPGAPYAPGTFAIAGDAAPAMGDLDGDDDPDLLVAGSGGALQAWRNGGSPVIVSFVRSTALESALSTTLSGFVPRSLAIGNLTGNASTGAGDRFGDVVVGSTSGVLRVLSFNGSTTAPVFNALPTVDTGLSSAVPALADLDGDGWTDLLVLGPDGAVRRYAHTGNPAAPFAGFTDGLLPSPVANAVSIAARDITEDGRIDVVIGDAQGRLWEFHREAAGTFRLASAQFAGSFNGFATRLSAALTDLDGDGDTDVIAGFAQGGLLYLRNQVEKLVLDPPARTLLVGTGQVLKPRAPPAGVNPPPPGFARGTVSWRFVSNRSGGTLNASSGQYVAGPTRGVVDVIEALDDRGVDGVVAGRSYVNVIGAADQTQAGKAVIIAGGLGVNDSVWPATNALANKAYRTLLFRGFRKDNIRYLSLDPNQDVDGNGLYDDIWRPTTFQFAQDALRNFGRGSNELFIALIDHGATVANDGVFVLRRPAGGTPERLLATQVNTWLGELQSGPAPTDVRLLMDFCFAGSFLQRLAAPPAALGQRVLMGSTASNQLAYLLSGGRISYSDTWLSAALQGFDLRTTANLARQSMAAYQAAQLDDDRDAVANQPGDGAVASSVRLGPSFVVGQDIPVVEQVTPPQALAPDTATAEVLLSGVTSVYPIDRAWCAVVPPGAGPGGEAPVTQASEFELSFDPTSRGWKGAVGGFTANGTYNLGCYVRDVWGSVSFPSVTQVVQSGYVQRLLLVVGGAEGQARFEEANAAGNAVYRAALLRGIPRAAIRYLNPRTAQDVDGDGNSANDVTGAPSTATFSAAFAQASAGADELTVFLVSGASSGSFELAPGQVLAAAQLDALLDGWQNAAGRTANVVLDFGDAEGWIGALAPAGCPASCPTDPAQHRDRFVLATTPSGVGNLMGNGGVLSATQLLVSSVLAGRSFGDAIIESQPVLNFVTQPPRRQTQRHDLARPDLVGVGGYAPGTPNDGRDLQEVRGRYFGPGFALGIGVPQIARRTPATVLAPGAPLFLWADGVTSSQDIVRVWAVVQPPGASGPLPEVDLALNPATQRWEGVYTATATPGEYRALVYARDRQGNVTPGMRAPASDAAAVRGTVSVPSTAPLTVGGIGPRVQFVQAAASVMEGASTSLIITLDAARASPLRVPLAILGSATNQLDYRVRQGQTDSPVEIVIAAGATSATLDLQALADAEVDGSEVVVLSLDAPSDPAVALGTNNTLTIAITDAGPQADLVFTNSFENP